MAALADKTGTTGTTRKRSSNRLRLLSGLVLACVVSASVGCQSLQSRGGKHYQKKGILGVRGSAAAENELASTVDPLGERTYNRFLLHDISPGQIGTTWAVRTALNEDRQGAEEAYRIGQQQYQSALQTVDADPSGTAHIEQFTTAANSFRLAAGKYPDSQIEHDALFYEGESYFFANRYVQSNRAFENLIGRYSGTRYLDKAEARRFAIAQYWLELAESGSKIKVGDPARPSIGLKTEGKRILHRIRLDDPTGKLADDSTLALANAYFKDELWRDAADTYEDLRINYPGSPHQFHAHLFELKSRVNSYQGSSYDDQPLRQADELLRSIVQQFPAQAKEEQEYLGKEGSLIRNQLAARDWSMAQYFENRGENRAATIYYEQVADEYEDTRLAQMATEQISEIAPLAPEPPKRAQWLVDIFPDTEVAKPVIASRPTDTLTR